MVLAVDSVAGDTDMYDLTVDGFHTYYVLAGATPVLVYTTWAGFRASRTRENPTPVYWEPNSRLGAGVRTSRSVPQMVR